MSDWGDRVDELARQVADLRRRVVTLEDRLATVTANRGATATEIPDDAYLKTVTDRALQQHRQNPTVVGGYRCQRCGQIVLAGPSGLMETHTCVPIEERRS